MSIITGTNDIASIEFIVTTAFNSQLDKVFNDRREVLHFLNNHERKNVCLSNIVQEVKKTERATYKLKRSDLEFIGKEYANTFANAALKHAEQQAVSDLEKLRMAKEYADKKEVMEMFESEDKSVSL